MLEWDAITRTQGAQRAERVELAVCDVGALVVDEKVVDANIVGTGTWRGQEDDEGRRIEEGLLGTRVVDSWWVT